MSDAPKVPPRAMKSGGDPSKCDHCGEPLREERDAQGLLWFYTCRNGHTWRPSRDAEIKDLRDVLGAALDDIQRVHQLVVDAEPHVPNNEATGRWTCP